MRDYACIMLDYKTPDIVKTIQKQIVEEDLYLGETKDEIDNNEYGLEKETHITIVYGLDNEVKKEEIEPYLFPLDEYKTMLVNISTFENEKFDVLKITAKSVKASESNKLINDNFTVHNKFNNYNPHVTIAYLKKGKGEKYKKNLLDKVITILPYQFNYSYSVKGANKNEYFTK